MLGNESDVAVDLLLWVSVESTFLQHILELYIDDPKTASGLLVSLFLK